MIIKIVGTREELISAAGYNSMNPKNTVESVSSELKQMVIDAIDDRWDFPGYNVEIEVASEKSEDA